MIRESKENHILPFLWMRGEEEAVLRKEIEKICECDIHAVCVEARPHKDYCGPGWWHDMDIVIDEAKKRDMKIWILDDKHFPTGYANGLIESRYPQRKKTYINYSTADIFGASHWQTLNVKAMLQPTVKFWELGNKVNQEERDRNKLVSVTALKFHHGNIFTEDIIDLSDTVDGDWATFQLPEGQWKIFVVYQTKTDGGDEAYINMIDRESAQTQIEGVYEAHYQKYGDLFGTVIAGFFSDEPQFGNVPGFEKEAIVGKKQMPLPWSKELAQMLEEKYGKEFAVFLPYLWNDTKEMNTCPKIRFDYMDCVSRLYEKNFSSAIGKWCEKHGVEYIGHVVEDDGCHSRLGMGAAHYFRAMAGQHMAGIDCIGGQIMYGAPDALRTDMVIIGGEFYHYLIGKMGASCGHLDPKKKGRTMCELFGAYGWKYGVRDMKYLLDHLMTKGINYLVPHAFSMAEYPDMDCPPHFYARGNNPEFPYFAELMKYGNRICKMLSGGKHIANAAVLYDAEAEWAGEHMPMQKVGRQLLEHQIDYDVISTDMISTQMKYYHTEIKGEKMYINNESFDVLIVPYTQRITKELAAFISQNKDFPVIFLDALPKAIVNGETKELMEAVNACRTCSLNQLVPILKEAGYYDVSLTEEFRELSVYHYQKNGQIFMLLNESASKEFYGEVSLPTTKKLRLYDGMKDEYEVLQARCEGVNSVIKLHLYQGQSCIIVEEGDAERTYEPENEKLSRCHKEVTLLEDWKVSKVKMIQYPEFCQPKMAAKLLPISDTNPSFSGIIRYQKTFTMKDKPEMAYLVCEFVYENMTVWVNGVKAGIRITEPYQLEIGKWMKVGENELCIEVATTADRDQMNYPKPPFVMKHVTMEPTGMFGNVVIKY